MKKIISIICISLLSVSVMSDRPITQIATLSSSCQNCSTGILIHFTGTGYNSKKHVIVGIDMPGTSGQYDIGFPDTNGNITFDRTYIIPGQYTLTAGQEYHQDWVALASITLELF